MVRKEAINKMGRSIMKTSLSVNKNAKKRYSSMVIVALNTDILDYLYVTSIKLILDKHFKNNKT